MQSSQQMHKMMHTDWCCMRRPYFCICPKTEVRRSIIFVIGKV